MFGLGKKHDMETAENYIREQSEDRPSALIRHYCIGETTDILEQFAGVKLADQDTVQIIQKLRNEHGYGPIDDYNLPGYIDPESCPEDYTAEELEAKATREEEQASRGGFFSWLRH